MGKKRVAVQKGSSVDTSLRQRALANLPKVKLSRAIVHVVCSFNNTKVYLTDLSGNLVLSSSAGQLGFKGTKKGSSYSALKVAELIAEKAHLIGVKEIKIVMKGIGPGRDSALKSLSSRSDIDVVSVVDRTPLAFNGPRPRKARRV